MFKSMAAAKRGLGGRAVSWKNGKMPGSTFAADPLQCKTGSILHKIDGSVCAGCYAIRIVKMRPSVAKGYAANELNLRNAGKLRQGSTGRAEWITAMVWQIEHVAVKTGERFHRWFDAGDLASVGVLALIVDVARETPTIAHWLPTRERKIVREYAKQHDGLPNNIVIRISATMIGDSPVTGATHTSTVHRKGQPFHGVACEASTRDNQCGDCRACWDPEVFNISYPFHR